MKCVNGQFFYILTAVKVIGNLNIYVIKKKNSRVKTGELNFNKFIGVVRSILFILLLRAAV